MKIVYDLVSEKEEFFQENPDYVENLNFVLSNNKGDFLNQGIVKNTTKFQGYNISNPKTLEVFKIIDEIIPLNVEPTEVQYSGHRVKRLFKSNITDENSKSYSSTYDTFYLGPSGGFIYEIKNFHGELLFDLDFRKRDDFDEWGRFYNFYIKSGILMVEYTKKIGDEQNYKLFMGIKANSLKYDYLGEWTKKQYSYSKRRNSLHELHLYRLLKAHIDSDKRFVIGAGLTEKEVFDQIFLLDQHEDELEKFDLNITKDITKQKEFEKPLPKDVSLSYRLSKNAMYKFLNKGLEKGSIRQGSYAGFPWFTDIWARDELCALKAYMDLEEYYYVKDRLIYYIDQIDTKTGCIKRINTEGSLESPDTVFWLAKRIEDFIFHLDEKGKLKEILSAKEIEKIYSKLSFSFNRIINERWDRDNELLNVNYGDSWMDTVELNKPLGIQVQLLEFMSTMGVLSSILGKKDEARKFLDLENGFKTNLKQKYFLKNSILTNEFEKEKITNNTFLAYYFHKDLLSLSEWEKAFDFALKHLKTSWGGIRSLSYKDEDYHDNYSGENNQSYHRGDVWYWINNIAVIALLEVNEKKYRRDIAEILSASTKDVLKMGAIGFSSEISSASNQYPEGCFAQLWSSSTYIEMVEKLFNLVK